MLNRTQKEALKWLATHGGDGVFDNHGSLIARGEKAPFAHSTWKALRDEGEVEFYLGGHRCHLVYVYGEEDHE